MQPDSVNRNQVIRHQSGAVFFPVPPMRRQGETITVHDGQNNWYNLAQCSNSDRLQDWAIVLARWLLNSSWQPPKGEDRSYELQIFEIKLRDKAWEDMHVCAAEILDPRFFQKPAAPNGNRFVHKSIVLHHWVHIAKGIRLAAIADSKKREEVLVF